MNKVSAVDEKRIRERARSFARHFTGNVFRNLLTNVLLWGALFTLAGFMYSRLILPGESIPRGVQAMGTVGILGLYMAAGMLAGLFFGTLATVRDMSADLAGAVGTVVDKGLVLSFPDDRGTVSVEEGRRILERVAPKEGGLSGLPFRLVRKKFLSEITARAETAGPESIRVADIREYATGKLVEAAVRDIRRREELGRKTGYILTFLFLAGPLALIFLLLWLGRVFPGIAAGVLTE